MTLADMIKDTVLPVLLTFLIASTVVALHFLAPTTDTEMCVNTLEFRRSYITNNMSHNEVLRWCVAHEDNWQPLIKLHNYSPKKDAIID